MSISQGFLEEIRSRLSLSDVIGQRIKVTRAGREYKACCPFHHEKTPSFTINDDKQFYHCFGCGAHGDVLKFVMEHDGLGFVEAVEMLAGQAGLQMPKFDPKAQEKNDKRKRLLELMDEAASWMQDQLLSAEYANVLSYAHERGLNEAAIKSFRIGFAPGDGQALRKYLTAKGYRDQEMMTVGLLKESTRGGQPYIFFRDRLMFPVADRRGNIVAFGGRILPDEMRPPDRGDYKPAKYINTSETPLFDKGRMLYGEFLARPAAREGHTLLVTEGYMDVIACYSAGFKGAVAPMGTALTDEQITLLWSMSGEDGKDPVLCFDGDAAGRRAASRACENLLPLIKAGRSARFAFLPDGDDPDSILKSSGRDAFKKVLMSSYSLFDFIWAVQTGGRKFDTPEARAGLQKSLNDSVSRIQDADVQKHYRELIRSRISDTFFTSRKKPSNNGYGNKGYGAKGNKPAPIKPRAPMAQQKWLIQERMLLAALINNPYIFDDVEEQLGMMVMRAPRHDLLRQHLLMNYETSGAVDNGELHSILKNAGFEQEINDILNESVYVHAAFCRPYDSETEEAGRVSQLWLAVYNEMNGRSIEQEIKREWQEAWQNSDEEMESRLKDIVQSGRSSKG